MASKTQDGKKFRDQVLVGRFQIVWPGKEIHERWVALSRECMFATNWLWQRWECYQIQHGMPEAIRKSLHENDEWKTKKRKKRPKRLQACDKTVSNFLYHGLSEVCPSVHVSTRGALQHRWEQNFPKLKASHGNLPLWMSILLCRDRRPGTIRHQPIPIKKIKGDKSHFVLLAPADRNDEKADWKIRVRLDRYIENGKTESHIDEVTLVTKTKKMRSHKVILERVASGEWEFCSSAIQYDDRRNKWELLLYHKRPAYQSEVSVENVAIVRPAYRTTWRIRTAYGSHRIGGAGLHVASQRRTIGQQRRRIILNRQSRKQNYRWASSAKKGRGTNRAIKSLDPLSAKWQDTVKTTNQVACKRIIEYCRREGIGRLVYIQPVAGKKRLRFLESTGVDERFRDCSGWAFYQLGDMLERKAAQYGIEVLVRKQNIRRGKESKADSDTSSARAGV